MFDQLLTSVTDTLNGFINNPIVQLGIRAIGIYIVLVWLATAFWAYRDMQHRTANPVAPYLAAALIVIFTPVLFLFAVLLYRIVRPKETVAEANERALAEEAMLADIEARPHCANCSRPVHEEWIICPTCRNRLRRVCPNCSRLVELDWSLCAWCGKDFERPEPVAAPYIPQPGPRIDGQPMPMGVGGPGMPMIPQGMGAPTIVPADMAPARER
jgi:RNA polymerase subunit RPABC4/transcription elongation factor Spt4